MTWSKLVKSISRREWGIVLALALVVMAITAVPPIFGYFVGVSRGLHWNGLQQLSPGDFSVYLSYIQQAKAGQLLSHNLFTIEPTTPSFNWLWWSVGRLAAWLQLGPIAAFHFARTILILPLAAVCYLTISFFLSAARERLLAFLLLFTGSGLGLYFAPLFLPSLQPNSHHWPIDLWVAEANVFASASYSPHFVASWTLLLLTVLFIGLGMTSQRWRYGLLSGVSALLLFQFHPFHAPTIYALGLVWLMVSCVEQRAVVWRAVGNYFLLVLMSAPVLGYHFLIMNADQQGQAIVAANQTATPWPWHLMIGFGVLTLAAPFGFWLAGRRKTVVGQRYFLAAWVLLQCLLVYAPFVFQRRLLEGLQFPLVILAVPAIIYLWDTFCRWSNYRASQKTFAAGAFFLVIFLPTSFRMIAGNIDLYWQDTRQLSYINQSEAQALHWIADHTPNDAAFISAGATGHRIVAWGERRVLFGHWVNSGDMATRSAEVQNFFGSATDQQRLEFMKRRGIGYIYYGPAEQKLGRLQDGESFARVFINDQVEIFIPR